MDLKPSVVLAQIQPDKEIVVLRQKVVAAAAAASAAESANARPKSSDVLIQAPIDDTSVSRIATTIPKAGPPEIGTFGTVQTITAPEKEAKLPSTVPPCTTVSSLSTKTSQTITSHDQPPVPQIDLFGAKADERSARADSGRSSRIISVASTNRIPRFSSASATIAITDPKLSTSPVPKIPISERSDIAMYEMMFSQPAIAHRTSEELPETTLVTDADRFRAMSAALPGSVFVTIAAPAPAATPTAETAMSTAERAMSTAERATPTAETAAIAIAAPAAIAALKDKWHAGSQTKPVVGSKIFSVCAPGVDLKSQDMDTTDDNKVASFDSFLRPHVFAPPRICVEKFNAVIPSYSFCACNLHHISQKQWISFHCSLTAGPNSSELAEMVACNLKEAGGGLWPVPKKTLPPRFYAAGFPKDICQLAYYGTKCDRTRCYHDHLSLFQVATLTGYPRQIPLTREQMMQMSLNDIASQSSPPDICTNIFNGRSCEHGQCCLYRHRTRYTFVRNQIARAPADAYTEAEMKQIVGLLGAGSPTFQSSGVPDGVCPRAYCSIPCLKTACPLLHLTPSVFAAYAGMLADSLWLSPFWLPPDYCPAHYLTGRCVMKENKECQFLYHQLRSQFLSRTNGLRLCPFYFIANTDSRLDAKTKDTNRLQLGTRALFSEWSRIAGIVPPPFAAGDYKYIFELFALSLTTSQNITSWHDALISKQTSRFGFLSDENKDEAEQKRRDLWKWCRNIVVVGREERIRRRAERAKSKRVTLGNIPQQIASARRVVRKAVKEDDKKKRKLASSASASASEALPDTFEDLIADFLTPEDADIECLDHL